jgi:UDP-N-acetylglucosamine 2-epimerase (non-hydrolysing)
MPDIKVVSIFGTRPEAVKMAPVIQRLATTPGIEARVIVTAQHRQMLDQVLNLFDIQPDYDLNLMSPDQSLAALTAAIFTHLDPLLNQLNPDWILVQGDTTTVMAAAILGYYHRIRIGHVEAGLRTGDKWQPFPEEINRRIAGVVTDLHFAPTKHSRDNLLAEGIPESQILVTGNPAIDALQAISTRPAPREIADLLQSKGIGQGGKRLVVITAHRRENFGAPLERICAALQQLASHYAGEVEFIYPVHLNPNVRQVVFPRLAGISNLSLLDPLDYLPMIHLMKQATLMLTDSGGIQEEATGLGIPTLVMRTTTERPEGVEAGTLKLVGTQTDQIIADAQRLLDDTRAHQSMAHAANPFGDGHAAERIVNAILNYGVTH